MPDYDEIKNYGRTGCISLSIGFIKLLHVHVVLVIISPSLNNN